MLRKLRTVLERPDNFEMEGGIAYSWGEDQGLGIVILML